MFRVNRHFGSREEVQNRFSRWRPWQASWISAFSHFNLQVTLILHIKFQVNWSFSSGEGSKYFFPIGTILAVFDLHIISILPTRLPVKQSFGSKEVQNRF